MMMDMNQSKQLSLLSVGLLYGTSKVMEKSHYFKVKAKTKSLAGLLEVDIQEETAMNCTEKSHGRLFHSRKKNNNLIWNELRDRGKDIDAWNRC